MTIGWIEEFVRDGQAVDCFEVPAESLGLAWTDLAPQSMWQQFGLFSLCLSAATVVWLRYGKA
jgi:hypothetical protein